MLRQETDFRSREGLFLKMQKNLLHFLPEAPHGLTRSATGGSYKAEDPGIPLC